MAIDEVLLGQAATGAAQLRIYRWTEPTLSLGYFQNISDRQSHRASGGCQVVRRSTGGGAIIHDREITYSLALPWSGGAAGVARQRELYRRIHTALRKMLGQIGVEATLCTAAAKQIGPVPFLCFQRIGEGDLVLGSFKVAGSAQRRVKGALLQHGSLLLEASAAAPELSGIRDLSKARLITEEWDRMVAEAILGELRWEATRHPLNEVEERAANDLVAERFANPGWTERR